MKEKTKLTLKVRFAVILIEFAFMAAYIVALFFALKEGLGGDFFGMIQQMFTLFAAFSVAVLCWALILLFVKPFRSHYKWLAFCNILWAGGGLYFLLS